MREMKSLLTILTIGLASTFAFAQPEFQQMIDADKSLASYAAEVGAKTAYLKYLGDDGVIFKPEATNGKDWWNLQKEEPPVVLKRTMELADISANGLLGYTVGSWEQTPKKKGGPERKIGQYITVWSKKPDGKFYAIIDVMTEYDEAAPPVGKAIASKATRDINKRRWSAADPSMKFLRMSMDRGGLGNAFDEWAAEDIRLIIEENPPIYGKKHAVKAMNKYLSVAFPRKVALLESADLAYAWNQCEYANSQEGMEKGTCLNIWKLRKKKWYITSSAFARIPNMVKPSLKTAPTSRGN